MNRRSFLASLATTNTLARAQASTLGLAADAHQREMKHVSNRRRQVENHNIVLTEPDPLSPLTLGNGEFAFTLDFTGLQTFPEFHGTGLPLSTLSNWGWHNFADPNHYKLRDTYHTFDVVGRKIPYPEKFGTNGKETPAGLWLRSNPHRMDLGRIGFIMLGSEMGPRAIRSVQAVSQTLHLFTGVIESKFEFDGQKVEVETVVHPHQDLIAVRVHSPLLSARRLGIEVHFPYTAGEWGNSADWNHPDRHQTELRTGPTGCRFSRTLDAVQYFATCQWSARGEIRQVLKHQFHLFISDSNILEFAIAFSRQMPTDWSLPGFDQTRNAAEQRWTKFWTHGGAVQLSGSGDPRWRELERRIVLSEYLTAVNCSGSLPPQETGLAATSWFGKFHLEMHWWHSAHFALWNRPEMLLPSLEWYNEIFPSAEATAKLQGYKGARWPKMVGPSGRESPSEVGPFLVWQQPHQIYFAELVYRALPHPEVLKQFSKRVFATADFLASYTQWNTSRNCYELGPPIISAQENCVSQKATAKNPTFELAYFYWALKTAQKWRRRIGLKPQPAWTHVADHLAPLPVRNGVYAEIETPVTEETGHPSMLAALGFLPRTRFVSVDVMRQTLHHAFDHWAMASTWGWDYPLMAMTAARLGEPEKAVDALLMETPKNRYLPNGYNFQDQRLPAYLPGNGGLLAAVAMMAAGWDGGPTRHAPGFPNAKSWIVSWEGLNKFP